MSGRLLRRAVGVFFILSALCLIPLSAGAVEVGAFDEEAGVQDSWSPVSFVLEYLSSLLPGVDDATSSSRASSTGGDPASTSAAGEEHSGDDGGEIGPTMDPDGVG